MNITVMQRINELRSKMARGEALSMPEMQEAVRLIRQDRRSAGEVSAKSKAGKAKAAIDVQGVLDEF